MEYKAFFKEVKGNEGERCRYATRLDTYGKGCSHNCSYCYARSLLDFRGLWNASEPSVADITKIQRVIRKNLKEGDVVRLGGMTDCFQPIEAKFGVTRATIKELNKRGVHYLIVTKSPLVAKYRDVLDKGLAHIQVSITSTDAELSKRIEPGAVLPVERIKAVEVLQAEGFDVAVRLSPFVPGFVDMDVINGIGCDKILVEFLRINGFIRRWMGELLENSFYSYSFGGYRHLPLYHKWELIQQIGGGYKEISVCEDVPEHWEYWRKNVNANPEDCCNLRF